MGGLKIADDKQKPYVVLGHINQWPIAYFNKGEYGIGFNNQGEECYEAWIVPTEKQSKIIKKNYSDLEDKIEHGKKILKKNIKTPDGLF